MKVAASIAESIGLRDWMELLSPGQSGKGVTKSSSQQGLVVDDATKSQLLKQLLGVYLEDG